MMRMVYHDFIPGAEYVAEGCIQGMEEINGKHWISYQKVTFQNLDKTVAKTAKIPIF